MSSNKRLIIQVSLFFIYLFLSSVSFYGYTKIMSNDPNPNTFISIITVFYISGGIIIFPAVWFGFSIYNQINMIKRKKEITNFKDLIAETFFSLSSLVFFLISFITLNVVDKESTFFSRGTLIYLLVFMLLLILLFLLFAFAALNDINKRSFSISFLFITIIIVLIFLFFIFPADLTNNLELSEPFIFSISIRQTVSLVSFLGLLHIFIIILCYFNVDSQLHFLLLGLNITMMTLMIANIIYMIAFFNFIYRP